MKKRKNEKRKNEKTKKMKKLKKMTKSIMKKASNAHKFNTKKNFYPFK